MKHVRYPQNMGIIRKADGIGLVGNPVCGDIMKFYIKVEVKKNVEHLSDAKFQTLGCGAAIATSSMLTVLVKGKPLKKAEKISKRAIIQALDGLPSIKIHCSVLADEGLKKAIMDYRSKKKSS